MLDEADPLRYLDLLLLGELAGGPRHVGGRIVELGGRRGALLENNNAVIVLKTNTRSRNLSLVFVVRMLDKCAPECRLEAAVAAPRCCCC